MEKRHKASVQGRSFLAEMLMVEFGDGDILAPRVARLAKATYNDIVASGGSVPASLEKLASLGTWGANPQNAKTELKDYIKSFVPVMEPHVVDLPLKILKSEDAGAQCLPQSYVLPHK